MSKYSSKCIPVTRRRAVTSPVGVVNERPLCSPTPSDVSWDLSTPSTQHNIPSPINVNLMKPFSAPGPPVNIEPKGPIEARDNRWVHQGFVSEPASELPQYPLTDPPSYSSSIVPPTSRPRTLR